MLALRHFAAIVFVMNSERPSYPTEAPNYTGAFLVSFGVIIFMALFTIWVVFGLILTMVVSWLADRLMTVDLRGRIAGR